MSTEPIPGSPEPDPRPPQPSDAPPRPIHEIPIEEPGDDSDPGIDPAIKEPPFPPGDHPIILPPD